MGKIEIDHTGAGSDITLSTDGTDLLLNGTAIGGGSSTLTIDDKTGAYTVVAGDLGKIINCTSGTFTVSLTAAATLGAGFEVTIWNTGDGTITIDPSGSETIDGTGTTYVLRPRNGVELVCSGSDWATGANKALRMYQESSPNDPNYTRPVASGFRSVAIGSQAVSSGQSAIAFGLSANASGAGGVAIGYATASGDRSVSINNSAGIYNTVANASNATAIGGNSSGSAGSQAVGQGAMALGGSYASGTDSFAAAIANNTSTYGATGTNGVALGYQTKASSSYSSAIGYKAQATGSGSLAISTYGWSASGAAAQSNGAIAIGNQITTGSVGYYAIAIGTDIQNTQRDAILIGKEISNTTKGKFVWGNGQFSASGDSQSGDYILRSDTTDATLETLTINNSGANVDNQVILPDNSAYAFHGTIVARQQASQGTACAAWKIEGLIRREGSTGTTVLVNSATTILDNTPAWGMALSADTLNGGLKIEVTGAAATNIRWVATINTSEVTY